ncbi:MAG: ParB N-terminal domain-containing protein [Candidatus Odinarchaeota archaeon]
MSKTKTYLFHELSSIFPLMEGEEFDDLVEDIKEHGLLEPIVLYDGKILDGRNRYRACQKLKMPLKIRNLPADITPLDFVISENIKRRHLTIAQRSEVGLLLLEEEEKVAQERIKQMEIEKAKLMRLEKEKKEKKDISLESKILDTKQKLEDMGEGKSVEKVAPKVKISSMTLSKAKKIKEVAKEDKKIAEDWERAKRGDIGVDKVYQEVKKKEIIETLPEPLKEKVIKQKLRPQETRKLAKTMKEIEEKAPELKEVILKPETKITEEKLEEIREVAKLPEDVRKEVVKEEISVKDAKDIAEIPKPELRKEAVKFLKKQELEKDYVMDVAKEKEKKPIKTIDLDMKIINQFTQIYKQVKMKMTKRLVESYNEQTKIKLLKIMKEILIHLQKELNIEGEIIEVEKT